MQIVREKFDYNNCEITPNTLVCGDCLKVMPRIKEHSVDLILCDLPYGRTRNSWDTIIPFDKLWENYKRVIKPNGAIVLFCDGMFMAELMVSNKKMWKYNIVWDKVLTSGFLNANKMPLRSHEEIAVFYEKPPTYNPQKFKGQPNHSKGTSQKNTNNNYGKFEIVDNREELGDMKHPRSIWTFSKPHPSKMVHPTEKPIECIEYIIKTYTNEGDLVLDNCMGSGTTGVGCVNLNRQFIGIEMEENFFDISVNRIFNRESVE